MLFVSVGIAQTDKELKGYSNALENMTKGENTDDRFEELPEMVIEFTKEELQRIRTMHILRRRILRVYPYVAATSENLLAIYNDLDKIESKREKKRYLKEQEKRLKEQFKEPLKKLSRNDGKVLVKLIYRQTGKSTYELMKELKSGWSAFWSNQMAWFYDLDLKDQYDPNEYLEDFYIEYILNDLKKTRKINYVSPVLEFDMFLLEKDWREKLGESGFYPESLE